jgi:hypothetical protein
MARDCVTIPGYGRSTRLHPRWYVGYLTYQGGIPRTPAQSLTGGGVVPARDFISTFRPVEKGYATATQDIAGGGTLVANEPSLLALLQPARGNGM